MQQKTLTFQKVGGLAALGQALSYIIGFTIFIFFLEFPSSAADPVQSVTFLINSKALIVSAMTLIYKFAALILLILVLALHDGLKQDGPILMQFATATGIIWAGVVVASGMIFTVGSENVIKLYAIDPERAATVWLAIGIIQDGLGGGTEFLGGVWIFAVSWIALQGGVLVKPLNWFGLLIGIAGILSVVPDWGVLVDVFGLSQIVWFIWIGVLLLNFENNPKK